MTASDETPMTDPADRARAFFAARRLVTRTLSDELGFSVDLVNTSGKLVAPEYGHGASEKDALVSAVKRYRIEEADWDQDGIQILLEFVPTTTASAGLRGVVASAFAREGLATAEYERPAFQMTAESSHRGWKWGSPSLSVHLVSNLPTIEVVEKLIQGSASRWRAYESTCLTCHLKWTSIRAISQSGWRSGMTTFLTKWSEQWTGCRRISPLEERWFGTATDRFGPIC